MCRITSSIAKNFHINFQSIIELGQNLHAEIGVSVSLSMQPSNQFLQRENFRWTRNATFCRNSIIALIKLISKISHSYITTHVADKDAAILCGSLFGQKVEAHRHDVGAVSESHAVGVPEVSGMDSASVGAVEEDLDIHGTSLAGSSDLRGEIRSSILRLNL